VVLAGSETRVQEASERLVYATRWGGSESAATSATDSATDMLRLVLDY
jgi:hypothetical protein